MRSTSESLAERLPISHRGIPLYPVPQQCEVLRMWRERLVFQQAYCFSMTGFLKTTLAYFLHEARIHLHLSVVRTPERNSQ